ncbi:MAG: dTDP-4-amino-4,6-dideoxygalactose transaminase [Planctomycetes bacterium]|nr:dTDP-4-amino-4,6-dideoxygalactose transaminase [Planctomycetota bacterium]
MANTAKPAFHIPYHEPYFDEREERAVVECIRGGVVQGGGRFTKTVEAAIRARAQVKHAIATTSGTHALELAMMVLNIKEGDEVIVPSYTFASTASCVVRQFARVVFCDVRRDNLNIDVADFERRITPRTKAVIPVHYAGIACDMDELMAVARKHNITVVEDAAQSFDTIYKGRALGTIGQLGCYSYHGTKNIAAGEGGALVTNDEALARRAEVLREKGTDRAQFLRGEVDKYTWRDTGSSFIPSELVMALLSVQLQKIDEIQPRRVAIYNRYMEATEPLERAGVLRRPHVPADSKPNAHIFYFFAKDEAARDRAFDGLRARGIQAMLHYYPLDDSPFGRQFRAPGEPPLKAAREVTDRMLRLPLFTRMTDAQVEEVVANLYDILGVSRDSIPRHVIPRQVGVGKT